MRLARFTLTCLLALGVQLQGFASVALMAPACPMPHGMEAATATDTRDEHSAHAPHVHDAAGSSHVAHGGHLSGGDDVGNDRHSNCSCLTGCHPVSSVPVAIRTAPGRLQLILQGGAPPILSFSSHVDSRHWRPPARA